MPNISIEERITRESEVGNARLAAKSAAHPVKHQDESKSTIPDCPACPGGPGWADVSRGIVTVVTTTTKPRGWSLSALPNAASYGRGQTERFFFWDRSCARTPLPSSFPRNLRRSENC